MAEDEEGTPKRGRSKSVWQADNDRANTQPRLTKSVPPRSTNGSLTPSDSEITRVGSPSETSDRPPDNHPQPSGQPANSSNTPNDSGAGIHTPFLRTRQAQGLGVPGAPTGPRAGNGIRYAPSAILSRNAPLPTPPQNAGNRGPGNLPNFPLPNLTVDGAMDDGMITNQYEVPGHLPDRYICSVCRTLQSRAVVQCLHCVTNDYPVPLNGGAADEAKTTTSGSSQGHEREYLGYYIATHSNPVNNRAVAEVKTTTTRSTQVSEEDLPASTTSGNHTHPSNVTNGGAASGMTTNTNASSTVSNEEQLAPASSETNTPTDGSSAVSDERRLTPGSSEEDVPTGVGSSESK